MSTRLERLVKIDALIRGNVYPTVQSLIHRFGMAERTVYDDLKFLKERLHAPLEYDRKRHGYYYTDQTWALPTFPITEGELLAFFISVELMGAFLLMITN